MPDFAEHLAAGRAERERQYDAGIAEWHRTHDIDNTSHLAPAAIADCQLCDPDGYRPNGLVCDHVDRTGIAAAGAARVREALAKGKPE